MMQTGKWIDTSPTSGQVPCGTRSSSMICGELKIHVDCMGDNEWTASCQPLFGYMKLKADTIEDAQREAVALTRTTLTRMAQALPDLQPSHDAGPFHVLPRLTCQRLGTP